VSKSDKSQNPENQLIRLRQYAEEHRYIVPKECVYIDEASGADASRPALDRLCKDARANRFSLILVVKIDRIARSMTNFHSLLKEWEAIGVKFHCIDQPEVSTDSSMGRLLMNILGAIAEFERDLIRDRTIAGLERARNKGKVLGRRPKVFDIERALELRSQGWGIKRIAKELKIAPATLRKGLKNGVENPRRGDPSNQGAKETSEC